MKKNEVLQETWKKRIHDYNESGLTMTEWCRKNELKLHQLQYWLKKYKELDNGCSSGWITIPLTTSTSENQSLEIKVGNYTIHLKPGFDATLLKEAIKVLSELC